MKLFDFLKINIRPIIFTTILTFGFVILIYIQTFNPPEYFLISTFVLYLLLLLELFSVRYWAKLKLKQLNIPLIDQYSHFTHLVLHVFLPTLSYWTICLFIFFEPNPGIWIIFILFTYFLFLMLFVNLRAYYEDKYKLEEDTHYIYDLFKLLIFALLAFNIFSLYFAYSLNYILVFLLLVCATMLLLLLNLLRHGHIRFTTYIYIFINAFINALINILLLIGGKFNIFEISFFGFLMYYMSTGVLYHKLKRDLSIEIVVEYVVVALLALAMFTNI